MRTHASRFFGVLAAMTSAVVVAQAPVDAQLNATIPSYTVPYSSFASPESRKVFGLMLKYGREAPPFGKSFPDSRAYYDTINTDRAHRMEALYPVDIAPQTIGGVATQVVTPKQGIAPAQKRRVLINLHGGAFLWGAGSGGLVESIPVASVGRIKVITVDYREGPENTFPAASEDVAAVFNALLKQYPAKNIGIYGCSAGGALTGESVAWFLSKHMPLPGAIGTFCSSVAPFDGDSRWVTPVLTGDPPPQSMFSLYDLPYFKGAKADDPLVVPANSPAMLAQFPPTLLISGTRDFAMSTVVQSERVLSSAGVVTEMHIWDGMWHSFFSDPEMPESREAYAVMAKFFDRHLGH
jgi:monoterpene epsilon-lactone hydrolase